MVGSISCIAKLIQIAENVNELSRQVVDDVCEEIYYESKEIMCPVDTGALKSTARNTVHDNGNEYYHEISFGGDSSFAKTTHVDHPLTAWGSGNLHMGFSSVNYAWRVHELEIPHYNPPTAQRKYLEVPVLQRRQKLLNGLKTAFTRGIEV
jgi:hypothetical protein